MKLILFEVYGYFFILVANHLMLNENLIFHYYVGHIQQHKLE